jgi:hypothetical protein
MMMLPWLSLFRVIALMVAFLDKGSDLVLPIRDFSEHAWTFPADTP